ncbi:hypothetical protein GF358_01440 [Candidatus Woesearchaeota archaeon]|nr:hypothetical protein [Candidatus Woesearchaeota archaeon]
MAEYKLSITIVGQKDGSEPGDMGASWYKFAEETLVSKIFTYPNTVLDNQEFELSREIIEKIKAIRHHGKQDHATLFLPTQVIQDYDDKKAEKKYTETIQKYREVLERY